MAKPPAKLIKKKYNNLKLGNLEVAVHGERDLRMVLMLWGPAGCGKTTFAATAPGDKLWLSIGDQEYASVGHRTDVLNVDLSALDTQKLFREFQSDDPFGLYKFLTDNPGIETVVCDNLTALAFRALQKAVEDGVGRGKGFSPTMEAPGLSAYGGRNAIVLACITGLLRVTAKHNVHVILTAHEDDPTTTSDGKTEIVDYIGVMLGGKLVNNMTWRLSEIWYMSQDTSGKAQRRLAIRPTRKRRPMKSRMFRYDQAPEFDLIYDASKPDDAKGQMTIAAWHELWNINAGQKLDIPGS